MLLSSAASPTLMKKVPKAITLLTIACFAVQIVKSYKLMEPEGYFNMTLKTRPSHHDQYLNAYLEVNMSKTHYITQFETLANPNGVHHILLYGASGVVYAWALGATALHMPEGVGLKLGPGGHKRLRMEVHFNNANARHSPPTIVMYYTTKKLPKKMGVFYLLRSLYLHPYTKTSDHDMDCLMKSSYPLHAFAVRTHAHRNGLLMSGYRVRKTTDGKNHTWTLILKKSPQLPQAFYHTTSEVELKKGDYVAARCVFRNPNSYPIRSGSTQAQEMCNYYVMYWVWDNQSTAFDCPSSSYSTTWGSSFNKVPKNASILTDEDDE